MKKPGKDREPNLHLPPGYHAHLDPEVLILSRADGSQVAIFSCPGFVAESVEQAAWADYEESEGASGRYSSGERILPRPRQPRPPG